MDSLKVDGVQAVGKNNVSVDSGIRLIIGEVNDVKALMSKVPGAKDGTTTIGPGFYSSARCFHFYYRKPVHMP
jgi:hypothetical protein